MSSPRPRQRLSLYPEPIRAPDVPRSKKEKPPNPRIYGWFILLAAFLMERVGFIRSAAWKNAGFGSLRAIWEHLSLTEPRFDPTVFPTEDDSDAADVHINAGKTVAEAEDGKSGSDSSICPNSAALYRSLYLSGELSPLDVARAILPLIRRDTSPPGANSIAWLEVHADKVLEAAAASTLRYRQKRPLGPLDGIPTAIKDEFDMEGYKTTLGAPNDYAHQHVPGPSAEDMYGNDDRDKNSWCVSKLEEAGAIILGKLSLHELGMDTPGYNITYGTPRNPFNPSYYTGGSSSGPAYAVASGLLPVALGSDGGGSIRLPSSFCSVFGLKPTHNRLSFLPCQNHSTTAAVNGPIAADMRSLIALYDVLNQPHPRSLFPPLAKPMSQACFGNNSSSSSTRPPRLLGIPEEWFSRADPVVQNLCRNLIDRLVSQKGYTVVPIDMPFVEEGQVAHAMTLLTDAATLVRYGSDDGSRCLSPANRILLALGRTTPATDYQLAQRLRHVLMQHLAWLWRRNPGMIMVTPATACAGWPIRSETELVYGISDGDQTMRSMEYVWLANFCGVPSISVPAGFAPPEGQARGELSGEYGDVPGKRNVPVGLMGTGEWCSEESLLRFGLDAEDVGLGERRRPPNWVDIVAVAKDKAEAGNDEVGSLGTGSEDLC